MLAITWLLGVAWAGPSHTRDALDRLDEVLELRKEDGALSAERVTPAIVVSTAPRYEASADWFGTRALEVLARHFGNDGLRLCEACMVPRAWVADGNMLYQTGPAGLDEVRRLDDQTRGEALPARTAIWVDEQRGGVGIKIVDLRNGRVLFAQNIDPYLVEERNTFRYISLSEELERRNRRRGLSQGFFDVAVGFPAAHVSMDFTDQWGKRNNQFSGATITVTDPFVGLGAVHYTSINFINMMFGGKVAFALPTALARSLTEQDIQLINPLLTVVGVVRVPFGRSNYGGVFTVSTNGQVGVGISLMNISLLPVFL